MPLELQQLNQFNPHNIRYQSVFQHVVEVTSLADQTEVSPIMQQIGMLNLHINCTITQLNAVMKPSMEENAVLKKENADLKAKTKN